MILQGKVMVEPQYLGRHNASGRDVYLLTLNSLNTLFFLPTSEVAHFACLCALNAKSLPPDEIGRFCSRLLDLGCAYFCAWGTESERVHDIMDEMVVGGTPPFLIRRLRHDDVACSGIARRRTGLLSQLDATG